MEILCPLSKLTDGELEARLRGLVLKSNELCAELIAHLAELDRRKLYPRWACPSLHAYCTGRLGLSDSAASKRIAAARQAAKFPVIIERLRAGKNHLSAVVALSGYLTDQNHKELLTAAEGLSQRALEKLIRMGNPLPSVPDAIRRLPARGPRQDELTVLGPATAVVEETRSPEPLFSTPDAGTPRTLTSATTVAAAAANPSSLSAQPEPTLDSASPPVRYKIQFTADQSLFDKIEQARALLSHQLPRGELAVLFDKALDRLIAELLQKKFGIRRGRRGRAQEANVARADGRLPNAGASACDEALHPTSRQAANEAASAKRELSGRNQATPRAERGGSSSETFRTKPERGGITSKAAAPEREPAQRHAEKRHGKSGSSRSRYVPKAVRKAVAERDELCCAFVGADDE